MYMYMYIYLSIWSILQEDVFRFKVSMDDMMTMKKDESRVYTQRIIIIIILDKH